MLESTSAETTTSRGKASNRIVICKKAGCHDMATLSGFCRLHYLSSWKKLKTKEAGKRGKKLEAYLQELSTRFPEEFLEKLKAEVEDMAENSSETESEKEGETFGGDDGSEEDFDSIMKGLKVEDF